MNFKDKLNQIRVMLGMQVKLEQMTLTDGAAVEAEAFEPEFSIGIVTEDGLVALPVGSYETNDGKVIVVEQEGIIASVSDKPAEETPEEVEAEKEPASEPAQAKIIVESVSKETFFEAVEKLTKENEALKAELEALKAPAKVEMSAEPIVHNPENVKKVELHKYGKPSSVRENIYKQLFN
jgi:hypothetical protein